MKIQGPGKSDASSKTKKKDKSDSAKGGDFQSLVESGENKGVSGAQGKSIAQVDALLAIQGAEDPAQGASRKRMHVRANDILDGLDGIRMAMLRGDLTVGHMIDIADVVASHREKITDPQLTAIMDEIDLRAQVELAKMRQALDQKKL